MNQEQFAALVARLEPVARAHPHRYRWQVMLLAGAGYLYLAFLFAFLLFALPLILLLSERVSFIALKLFFVVIPLLWLMLKALWIRFEEPDGRTVTDREAPALFAMIAELRRALRSQPFHRVLITTDFNASVVQVPRMGPFGWHRNFLTIGLPLMKALTPEQLKAVLAHEFGHLAGGHGAFSNHIYRLRLRWAKLLDELQRRGHWGLALIEPFFRRYSPYFSAYTFPLARANEYHADAVAARLTTPAISAQALTAIAVADAYLANRYWPEIQRGADTCPTPSVQPFHNMGSPLAGGVTGEDARGWIEQAMSLPTRADHTHPAMSDRLGALAEAPCYAPPNAGAAADTLLGDSLANIAGAFDRQWQKATSRSWEARYVRAREDAESKVRFAAIEESGETLNADDALRYAKLLEAAGASREVVIGRLRQIVDRAPDHAESLFSLGARMLADGNEEGIALLDRSGALDPELDEAIGFLGYQFYESRQMTEKAKPYAELNEEGFARRRDIEQERIKVRASENFHPHDLAVEQLERIVAALKSIEHVRIAFLVRRQLPRHPQVWTYLLGYSVSIWHSWHRKSLIAGVQAEILRDVPLPENAVVFCVNGDNDDFWERFRKIKGARIV